MYLQLVNLTVNQQHALQDYLDTPIGDWPETDKAWRRLLGLLPDDRRRNASVTERNLSRTKRAQEPSALGHRVQLVQLPPVTQGQVATCIWANAPASYCLRRRCEVIMEAPKGTDCKTKCKNLLAMLRAMHLLHHTAHLQASGETSYQDHLLFERLYGGLVGEADKFAEKVG